MSDKTFLYDAMVNSLSGQPIAVRCTVTKDGYLKCNLPGLENILATSDQMVTFEVFVCSTTPVPVQVRLVREPQEIREE